MKDKNTKLLQIGFENLESILIPFERVKTFEHGDLELFDDLIRDFELDYEVHKTGYLYLAISFNDESDLKYDADEYDEPLGMYLQNPTSNYVSDRPNILGRILGHDVVDIQLLDEEEQMIQNIYVPWGDEEVVNTCMSMEVKDNLLHVRFVRETLVENK